MKEQKEKQTVPASEAALRLGLSRERVLRKIQVGELAGELRGGRWFVQFDALEELVRELRRVAGPLGRARITA